MLLKRLFDGNKLSGVVGQYPLTAENLFRVGLALCTYLLLEEEKPTLGLNVLNFATMSLAVGFMAGGGDVFVGDGKVKVFYESLEEDVLVFEGLEEVEFKKIESILFSRYNIPRKQGQEVGKLWIEGKRL